MFRIILFVALGLTLLIPAAHARFVLLDAIFDDKPPGASLGRQGARFEEPIYDPADSQGETIVLENGADYAVRIRDRRASGADALVWAFKDNIEVVDGHLNIALDIRPNARDAFEVVVTGTDAAAPPFFRLQLDHSGSLKWADGDDPAPTSFGSYSAADSMHITLAFNLAARTYTFAFNGFPIRTAEPHGAGAGGIARLRVGNGDDGNTTGYLDLDNLFVDQATTSADLLLWADFNDQPLNTVIGTGGAALGQPISYQGTIPVVDAGGLPTPSLLIRDLSTTSSGFARFEFLNSREVTAGDVSMSFVLVFNPLEYFTFYVREQGAAAQLFLNMEFFSSGMINLKDAATPYTYQTIPYLAQVPMRFELAFDMSAGRYYIWLEGERVVHRKEHGVTDRGVGALLFGTGHDTNLTGGLRVDDIRVQRLGAAVSAVGEALPPHPALLNLGAIPNPFRPSSALRFSLAEAGRLKVEVLDPAGRRLALLADQDYSAGDHALRWNGADAHGRALASGVYFTRMTLAGTSGPSTTASRKLVLLR